MLSTPCTLNKVSNKLGKKPFLFFRMDCDCFVYISHIEHFSGEKNLQQKIITKHIDWFLYFLFLQNGQFLFLQKVLKGIFLKQTRSFFLDFSRHYYISICKFPNATFFLRTKFDFLAARKISKIRQSVGGTFLKTFLPPPSTQFATSDLKESNVYRKKYSLTQPVRQWATYVVVELIKMGTWKMFKKPASSSGGGGCCKILLATIL